MSKIFGTNESLVIDDEVDNDGELNVSMTIMDSDYAKTDTWLNKAHAIGIIDHLSKVFDL